MSYELSIIIPFQNSKSFINQSLKNTTLLANKYNIEIIYINDNSKDNTNNIITNNINNINNIKLFKTNLKKLWGPGIARNVGIRKAKSNLLLFLDVDDLIDVKYMYSLLQQCKTFRDNLIYLEKKSIAKLSPYVKYYKHNIKNFFKRSNNMQSISIIFNKKFLIKNNLFFKNGIFEDIYFLFKCHYFNLNKIGHFKKKIYIKNRNIKSLTNSKKTFNKIKFKFNAFKSIENFLKEKNFRLYNRIYDDIQYRWRNEVFTEYNSIIKEQPSRNQKKILIEYIKKLYKQTISKKFKVITAKDKAAKKILFDV
jgi:glycosyltransferase involved in cell wall biosynthesis